MLARAITVVMKNTYMTDTVLHWMEDAVSGTSQGVFGVIVLVVNVPIALLVPSSSGHAALVMPILAPLADFAGVGRDVAVTAYQSASGLVNLVTPTSAVIMGGLALSKVGYDRYLQFVWKFAAAAFVVACAVRRRRGRPELNKESPLTAPATPALGVASEVGTLHSVMVHRPDLAHERLSPSNCHELLFDDVIWTRRARQEFDAFVDLMRSRGVEVLLLHELLAETLAVAEAREWLLSRRLRPEEVTALFSDELQAWMGEMPAEELATRLTGGVTVQELPDDIRTVIGRALRATDFVLAPLPNQLFTRDTSAWLYGGSRAERDVLDRAPARVAERRGDLPLPPAVPRRRLPDLVRRRRPRLGAGDDRGRRHDARRATAWCSSVRASAAPRARRASWPRTCSRRARRGW